MSLEDSQAPEFTLRSTGGGDVSLSDKLDSGPVVVLTNRGHWYLLNSCLSNWGDQLDQRSTSFRHAQFVSGKKTECKIICLPW